MLSRFKSPSPGNFYYLPGFTFPRIPGGNSSSHWQNLSLMSWCLLIAWKPAHALPCKSIFRSGLVPFALPWAFQKKRFLPSWATLTPLSSNFFFFFFFEDTKALHPDPQSYIYLVCLVLILGLAKKENISLCWIKHFTASCPGSQDSLSYWPAALACGFDCISPCSCSVVSGTNSVLTWIQGQS